MGCSLHQHQHSHTGSSNSHIEAGESRQSLEAKENINVKAAFIHVIGDFVQSLGVFIAALMIYFKPQWKIVDPICTFIFSLLVLGTTISILRNTMNVLMEGKLYNIFSSNRPELISLFTKSHFSNVYLQFIDMF